MDTEIFDENEQNDATEELPAEKPKKKVKKSKSAAGETKTKKTKTKKQTIEKQSISVKSSFSKFDTIEKSNSRIHVRSSDSAEAVRTFTQQDGGGGGGVVIQKCRKCDTQVFQMEQIKAERAVWHKSCFRCKECNKQLSIDTYGSHEGDLYCKPHLKQLLRPKTVEIDEDINPFRRLKPRMIISENTPEELPADVVRASEKPDLGLEELSGVNIKSRFQMFQSTGENGDKNEDEDGLSNKGPVKRSPSILSKLAKFQSKGMDIGVNDDLLSGVNVEDSGSESEGGDLNDESDEGEGKDVRSTRKCEDMRNMWEMSQHERREEQRAERKEDLQKLRSKLLMGKCGRIKDMYTQAVQESTTAQKSSSTAAGEELAAISAQSRAIKERFERGEITNADDDEQEENGDDDKKKNDDRDVVEYGISKKSRSLFLEMDSASKQPLQPPPKIRTPTTPSKKIAFLKESLNGGGENGDTVKASDKIDDIEVQTEAITSRFKFFEQYQQNQTDKPRKVFRITPPRDGQVKDSSPERPLYQDESVVRASDRPMEEELVRSQTASRMLSLFRQMETSGSQDNVPAGPKPLKCFTPPPDYRPDNSEGSDEEESEEEEEESGEEGEEEDDDRIPGVIRASDKIEDEFLKSARNATHAKNLRAKFEQWESSQGTRGDDDDENESNEKETIESTSNLRAMFENMNKPTNNGVLTRQRPKVNRFVPEESQTPDLLQFETKVNGAEESPPPDSPTTITTPTSHDLVNLLD